MLLERLNTIFQKRWELFFCLINYFLILHKDLYIQGIFFLWGDCCIIKDRYYQRKKDKCSGVAVGIAEIWVIPLSFIVFAWSVLILSHLIWYDHWFLLFFRIVLKDNFDAELSDYFFLIVKVDRSRYYLARLYKTIQIKPSSTYWFISKNSLIKGRDNNLIICCFLKKEKLIPHWVLTSFLANSRLFRLIILLELQIGILYSKFIYHFRQCSDFPLKHSPTNLYFVNRSHSPNLYTYFILYYYELINIKIS